MTPFRKRVIAVATAIVTVLVLLLLLLAMDEWLLRTQDFTSNSSDELTSLQEQTAKNVESYNQWVVGENRRVFEWHIRSTKLIFWVSILITITGMAFAFWQFVDASHTDRTAMDTEELELKTHLASLAFKSRSLATFMVFVSLAYLLIYVTLVYPITPVSGTTEIRQEFVVPPPSEDPEGIVQPDGNASSIETPEMKRNSHQEEDNAPTTTPPN